MIIIAWVLGLGLLTWIFADWEEAQYNPNQDISNSYQDGNSTVSLTRNRWGHYIFNGKINNQEVTFLVDTGATEVAVPGAMQKQLGLISGRSKLVQTANGTTRAYSTELDSLAIGNIRMNNVKASIVPNMEGNEILLGMSVLKHLEFSQKGNQLILKQ
ncbi:TIGR02281 family clan AA aspartic protease [Aliikangiella marina]|uniref:TIGR02281 family clan AA aspartic protease n=2 Tax=Aliikangiella marina TaxID=1712262 RepID=A0A545T3A3_9GAMM|nr:TIGR02281 family clan AA aspartic protease [Aliikangiella marina]